MLQYRVKVGFMILLVTLLISLLIPGCRKDTSTHTEDEATYLADYEAPPNKWGYIDTSGNLVSGVSYDAASPFSEGYAAVNIEGKWGYIDRYGKQVIQPQYKSAWAFHEGKARVRPFGQTDQYITTSGDVLSSDAWSAADDFSDGLARVRVGNTYGFIDNTGRLVIPASYSRGWNFHQGLAVIALDEKAGLINKNGVEIIPPLYDKVQLLENEKLVLCSISEEALAFDLQGNKLVSLAGVQMMDSDGRLISVKKGSEMYFYDISRNETLPGNSWQNIIWLGGSRWAGKDKAGYYLLDENGKKLTLKFYSQINKFNDGIAAYHAGTFWGYMDLMGRELTIDVFGLAWDYKEGYARASFTEGIGFLDKKQQLAFYPPPGTMDMRDFSEGLAPVQIAR